MKVFRQYFIPQHLFSRMMGWFTSRRWKFLKNWQIKRFIRVYNVDMSIAQISNPEDYPDFNHFFVRHLLPEARPIAHGANNIVSPVDGTIAQMGKIHDNQILQAKNHYYSTRELLGGINDHEFIHGQFATIYLSPKDYHRMHMPIDGTLRETLYVPGKLFSVNQRTASRVPNLYAQNERVVCIFDTAAGPMAMVFVGAIFVASIYTEWSGIMTPGGGSKINHTRYHSKDAPNFSKGEDIAHFRFGSTVILLFGEDSIEWSNSAKDGNSLKMGQAIANTCE